MIKLRQKSFLSYFIQPFFVILLLCGIFAIIWLRSGIISMEYTISELENRKMDRLRETKMLLAERASALSMQKVEKTAALDLGLVAADRTKVVFVKAVNTGPSRASLDKRYEESYGRGEVPQRMSARAGVPDGEAHERDDIHYGGYQ